MSSWSKCSKTCGSGHQIRGVFCSRSNNKPLNTSACDGKTKPTDLRRCFLKECILKRGLYLKWKNVRFYSQKNILEHKQTIFAFWYWNSFYCFYQEVQSTLFSLWQVHKSRATFSWSFTRNFLQSAFDVLLFESPVLTLVFKLIKAQAPAETSWTKHKKNSQCQTIISQFKAPIAFTLL